MGAVSIKDLKEDGPNGDRWSPKKGGHRRFVMAHMGKLLWSKHAVTHTAVKTGELLRII